jgi:hypothetical protein
MKAVLDLNWFLPRPTPPSAFPTSNIHGALNRHRGSGKQTEPPEQPNHLPLTALDTP